MRRCAPGGPLPHLCSWPLLAALGLGSPGAARAEVMVTGTADHITIDLAAETPAREVVAGVAAHLGVRVTGDPGEEAVAPRRFAGVGLHAALARLLPHTPFAIRYGGAEHAPQAISFLRSDAAPPGPDDAAPQSSATAVDLGNRAGVPVPAKDRKGFADSLPMLRTR